MPQKSLRDSKIVQLLEVIVLILVVVGYIEWRVNSKVNNPDFIQRITSTVRPAVIFDQSGTVQADLGGMQYISGIKVTQDDKSKEPKKITVSFNEHINSAPILECTNYDFSIQSEKSGSSDWIFHLSSPSRLLLQGSMKIENWLFRLEVIR